MFENFCRFFNTNPIDEGKDIADEYKNKVNQAATGYNQLMANCEGMTFGNGLYRLHKLSEIKKWNEIVEEAFPDFAGRIECFGYDWLGRQFSLDVSDGTPNILMYEPGSGEALQAPSSFYEFHEKEIAQYHADVLASSFFSEWYNGSKTNLKHDQCVGYKVPLYLNGEDDLENLEISDMEVYWYLFGQLRNQIL
ncbi:MAG: T6SS immunity protein Tdi1 domain-containing protein [Anaerofustis sp.]